MSKNPEKIDFLTSKHKKKMVSFMVDIIKDYRTCNVAEGLVEFVERKRVLVAGTSARPGAYRYSVTPYLREPADCLSDHSKIYELVMMKGTQTGGTDGIMMNHELYCIYYGIGGIQYITSDDDLAQEHMEKRIDPMISAASMQKYITPAVKKKSNKSTGDTKRSKSFGGTFLRVTGANSESKLSSLPSRILHIDEIDKFKISLSGGGNPVEKAVRRTDSYGNLMKIVYISTPKERSTSQIEPLFKQGDMRYYYIPCPKCGHMQKLIWSQMKWDKDENKELLLEYDEDGNLTNDPVYYECIDPECKYHMKNHEKINFMKEVGHGGKAEWRASKKPDRPGIRSYHVSALYGFRSWINIAIQWTKIKGDPTLRQDFMNDTLGETYYQKMDKPEGHILMERAENWERGQIVDDVKILTLGCDVHPDRLELQIMGYGYEMQSWPIEYHVFWGNCYEVNDPVWDQLEEVILKEYEKDNSDKIFITTAFIDANGKASPTVRAFVDRMSQYYNDTWVGVFAMVSNQTQADKVKEKKSLARVPEVIISDQALKKEIYGNLMRKAPIEGDSYKYGVIHFPSDYPEDYYKQLTAEEFVETEDKRTGQKKIFISNSKQRRNESLDNMKMALGALYFIYYKFFKIMNDKRKKSKKSEIPDSWANFWAFFDAN